MGIKTGAKGDRIELMCVEAATCLGYTQEKARMSKGVFDRVFERRGDSEKGKKLGDALRYVQIKGMKKRKGWNLKRRDVEIMSDIRLSDDATREVWRHVDHSGQNHNYPGYKNYNHREPLCIEARLLQPDGKWVVIPVFSEEELLDAAI